MRSRPAHKQTGDPHLVTCRPRRRTKHEHLVNTHLTMENIAARNTKAPFEIERREHLPMLDDPLDVGTILLDQVNDAIPEWLAQVVPISLTQRVRSVLQENPLNV